MPIPFWVPSLWVAASLLAWPQTIWLTILGYHALCLIGSAQRGVWRSGQSIRIGWIVAGLSLLLLAIPFALPPLSGFPHAAISSALSQWPGGLRGQAAYALLVNVPVEEAYWRGALIRQHPDWSPVQHGAAFGLHHAIAAAVMLPWPWLVPAFVGPAIAGVLWAWLAKRTGGIAFPVLGHAIADLSLLVLAALQLS